MPKESDDEGIEFGDFMKEDIQLIERTLLTEAKASTTFDTLYANTAEHFPVTASNAQGFPYRFQDFKEIPYRGTNMMRFIATCTSQERGNQRYPLEIAFFDVNIDENELPDTSKNPVRVRCSCPHYYFACSYWNWMNDAHSGRKPKPYQRKTTTRPEANPTHSPAACKHLIAMVEFLIRSDKVK